MTPCEKKLWYQFLRSYPIRFQRQKPIGDYIADFYCAKAQIVIELDGNYHDQMQQMQADRIRTQALEKLGLKVIRFQNGEITKDFYGVITAIDHEVRKRLIERGYDTEKLYSAAEPHPDASRFI